MSVAEIYKQVLEGGGEFGVPTKSIELDPREIAEMDPGEFIDRLRQSVDAFVKERSDDMMVWQTMPASEGLDDYFSTVFCRAIAQSVEKIDEGGGVNRFTMALARYHYRCPSPAMSDMPGNKARHCSYDYIPPDLGAVTCEKIHSVPEAVAADLGMVAEDLEAGIFPSVPGEPENWMLVSLLHEQAHIAGAAEPQADAMAAMRYRQLLGEKDIEVLQAYRDIRVILAVYHSGEEMITEEMYGWRCVTALDDALSKPKDEVMSMTQGDFQDAVFKDYGNQLEAIHALREKVKKAHDVPADQNFYAVYMDEVRDTLQDMLSNGELDDVPVEKHIAEEYCTSFDRLILGDGAYAPDLTAQFANVAKAAPAHDAASLPPPALNNIRTKF